MPRVTTVEAAAEPLVVPPLQPHLLHLELAAPPDVLPPTTVEVSGINTFRTSCHSADAAHLQPLPFSSSCVLPPLMTSWIMLSRLAFPVFVTRSGRSLKFASDLTEIEAL